jgi:hypothetical protein
MTHARRAQAGCHGDLGDRGHEDHRGKTVSRMAERAAGNLRVMTVDRTHEPGLTEDDLTESLKKVAVTLKGADIPFALAGSFAAYARGGPQPVHDVDFFVLPQDVERAQAALRDAGLRIEQPPLDWLFKAYDGESLVDLIHHPLGRPVRPEVLDRADDSRFSPCGCRCSPRPTCSSSSC